MTTAICAVCCICVIDETLPVGVCFQCAGLKSEHVFKMAARVCSTSSEEMVSSSEDSASEDPINIAKGRGADLKEPENL